VAITSLNSERTRCEEVKVEVEKNIGRRITQELNHFQLLPSTLTRLSLKHKLVFIFQEKKSSSLRYRIATQNRIKIVNGNFRKKKRNHLR